MDGVAQLQVKAAAEFRQKLAAHPVLTQIGTQGLSALLQCPGVTRLQVDQAHPAALAVKDVTAVNMGVFRVPPMDNSFITLPKGKLCVRRVCKPSSRLVPQPCCGPHHAGFDEVCDGGISMFLEAQRVRTAAALVAAVRASTPKFGELLTGPNGAGKSGHGLLAALACMAQGLLVAYQPQARVWVTEARRANDGDTHILTRMWQQNADLIAAHPVLREIFAPALAGRGFGADGPAALGELRTAVASRRAPCVGIIIDEVQRITEEVTTGKGAASYFQGSWHDWENENMPFPRLSIASFHGGCEFHLPSGEDRRLHAVHPWSQAEAMVAMSDPKSPAHLPLAARFPVWSMAGGVPGLILRAKRLLAGGCWTKAVESWLLVQLRTPMEEECQNWFTGLKPHQQLEVAQSALALVRGELDWPLLKPMRDAGLMQLHSDGVHLEPVSHLAGSVLLHVLSKVWLQSDAKKRLV